MSETRDLLDSSPHEDHPTILRQARIWSDFCFSDHKLVASHLLKSCHYWTDTGEGVFELHYLRDKDKHEIDFLITKDGTPWLPIEVQLHDAQPSPHWRRFLPHLPCDRGIQIVSEPAWKLHDIGAKQILVAGAAELLAYFV